MIEKLETIDKALFLVLNGAHADWLDPVMWFFSKKAVWIPFYLFLLILFITQYGWRQTIVWILPAAALLIALSDQSSVHLFKRVFERYRPCHNLEIQAYVHLVNNYCGGKFGFVSSHASNTFALAFFVTRLSKWKSLSIVIFIWAIVVSYSRIYLGVHYPADILGGALLGTILAYLVTRFVSFKLKSKN
jgi:undecaprenyl-diphosphatase